MIEKLNGVKNISFGELKLEPTVELTAPKVDIPKMEIPQMEFPKLEFDMKPSGLEEVSLGELPSIDDEIMVLNL